MKSQIVQVLAIILLLSFIPGVNAATWSEIASGYATFFKPLTTAFTGFIVLGGGTSPESPSGPGSPIPSPSIPAGCYDTDKDKHYEYDSRSCQKGDDCDDLDATLYPGAPEICDGKDNNCNGPIDETDVDKDKWNSCMDCNDNDKTIHPTAPEVCGNKKDDDCDLVIDENCPVSGDSKTGTTNPPRPPAVCGNGIIDTLAEECDDGNAINGDGCSSTCITEYLPSEETAEPTIYEAPPAEQASFDDQPTQEAPPEPLLTEEQAKQEKIKEKLKSMYDQLQEIDITLSKFIDTVKDKDGFEQLAQELANRRLIVALSSERIKAAIKDLASGNYNPKEMRALIKDLKTTFEALENI